MKRERNVKMLSNLAEIAELSGITVAEARLVREAVIKCLREALIRREPIHIRGFGTFTYWESKRGRVIHPGHGAFVGKGGGWRVRFTPHEALRALLNPHEYET